jgi:hypothetical protein
MSEELKACPLCNNKASIKKTSAGWIAGCTGWIYCCLNINRHQSVYSEYSEEATQRWNRRAND